MDLRLAKWNGWIDGTVKSNVLTMHLHRHAWEEVTAILQANPDLPESYWWEFMHDTYATTQAVAVRRQADTHRGVASLGKLVEEIAGDPSHFTREYYIRLWDDPDPYWLRVAQEHWDETYAGLVGNHLDPAIPAADLETLKAAAERVTHYVDKHVAHADAGAVSAEVTVRLSEVHDTIDTIGTLFKKYAGLFSSSAYGTLVPVIPHNWKAAFSLPWMKPRERRQLSVSKPS